MSSELPLLTNALMQYSMLSYRLSLFLFNGEQESVCKEIRNYSIHLHKMNFKYKTLPIEIKELNGCVLSILEKANEPFVLEYFKTQMEGLTYVSA